MIVERVNRFFGLCRRSTRSSSARAVRRRQRKPIERPGSAPVPHDIGEGLRAIADPGLRACLESLAGKIAATTGPPAVVRSQPYPRRLTEPETVMMSKRLILVAASLDRARGLQCRKPTAMPPPRRARSPQPRSPRPMAATGATVTAATPEGGFVMGNPAAAVKLVEYGSLTCPHCRRVRREGRQAADRQLRQERAGQLGIPQLRPRSVRHHRVAGRALRRRGELLRR